MQPDVNRYLKMMEDWDMTHDAKIQFIHELWHIMESFVDRAFGIHPTQQCRDKNRQIDLQDSSKELESDHSHHKD